MHVRVVPLSASGWYGIIGGYCCICTSYATYIYYLYVLYWHHDAGGGGASGSVGSSITILYMIKLLVHKNKYI